jgi:hypothetical protein
MRIHFCAFTGTIYGGQERIRPPCDASGRVSRGTIIERDCFIGIYLKYLRVNNQWNHAGKRNHLSLSKAHGPLRFAFTKKHSSAASGSLGAESPFRAVFAADYLLLRCAFLQFSGQRQQYQASRRLAEKRYLSTAHNGHVVQLVFFRCRVKVPSVVASKRLGVCTRNKHTRPGTRIPNRNRAVKRPIQSAGVISKGVVSTIRFVEPRNLAAKTNKYSSPEILKQLSGLCAEQPVSSASACKGHFMEQRR